MRIGKPLDSLPNGWSPFTQPLYKCWQQRNLCYPRFLPSFVVSRTPFNKPFPPSLKTLLQNWRSAWSKCTSSSALTMVKQTAHLIMSGHVVSCSSNFSYLYWTLLNIWLVLDPRIGYSGLVADCAGDPTSLQEVDNAKDKFEQYFCTHYCTPPSRPATPPPSSAPPS